MVIDSDPTMTSLTNRRTILCRSPISIDSARVRNRALKGAKLSTRRRYRCWSAAAISSASNSACVAPCCLRSGSIRLLSSSSDSRLS